MSDGAGCTGQIDTDLPPHGYPTVATTYTYRVFGTVQGAPFDVTFTCSPAGQVATEDKSVV